MHIEGKFIVQNCNAINVFIMAEGIFHYYDVNKKIKESQLHYEVFVSDVGDVIALLFYLHELLLLADSLESHFHLFSFLLIQILWNIFALKYFIPCV